MDKIIIVENKQYKIDKSRMTIGRATDCDIHLPDDKVSRIHGIIHSTKKDLFYEDNSSSNGSYLNNKLVKSKKKISEGDIIQIGTFVLKVDLEIPTRKYPALDESILKSAVTCPGCKKSVSSESKFCVFCGTPIKTLVRSSMIPCPDCGELVEAGAEKCASCGITYSEETYKLDLSEVTPVYLTQTEARKKKIASVEVKEKDIETEILDTEVIRDATGKLLIFPGKPAGFWSRFIAMIIDAVAYNILQVLFVFVPVYAYLYYFQLNSVLITDPKIFYNLAIAIGTYVYLWIGVANFILALLYFPRSWVKKGGTIGKRVLGIYIFSDRDSQTPISWKQAIIRYISYTISTLILYIGFIMIAFDPRKRGLHDKLAGTFVARKR